MPDLPDLLPPNPIDLAKKAVEVGTPVVKGVENFAESLPVLGPMVKGLVDGDPWAGAASGAAGASPATGRAGGVQEPSRGPIAEALHNEGQALGVESGLLETGASAVQGVSDFAHEIPILGDLI